MLNPRGQLLKPLLHGPSYSNRHFIREHNEHGKYKEGQFGEAAFAKYTVLDVLEKTL